MPNWIPDHYWQVILVDQIMEPPLSWGYDTIMVVVDHLSKQAHVMPTMSDITATGVAWLFLDHIWKLHGLPEEVISDQGTQFVSNLTQSLSQLLGIQVGASDRPKGLTKRSSSSSDSLWTNARMIASISEFAYNNLVHASTCSSPFMMATGQNHWLGIELLRESHLHRDT